jgi:hypothetical protein
MDAHTLRILLVARSRLVSQRQATANTIRGLLKTFGLVVAQGSKGLFPVRVREQIADNPAHSATAPAEPTPSTGRNSGMMGLSIENAAVMTNWIPTIAHKVRCHGAAALVSVPAVFSSVVALTRSWGTSGSRLFEMFKFGDPLGENRRARRHRGDPSAAGG